MSNKRGKALIAYAVMLDRSTGAPLNSGVTAKISKDGAAIFVSNNTPASLGDGLWWLLLTDAEADAKQIGIVFIHSSGVYQLAQITTVLYDPDDVDSFGLSALTLSPDGFLLTDLRSIQGRQTPAVNLAEATSCLCTGVVGAGSSVTTIIPSAVSPPILVVDQMRNRDLNFPNDTLTPELRGVTTSVIAISSLGVITIAAIPVAPQAGDRFVIS